jgi:hypothetical protein
MRLIQHATGTRPLTHTLVQVGAFWRVDRWCVVLMKLGIGLDDLPSTPGEGEAGKGRKVVDY